MKTNPTRLTTVALGLAAALLGAPVFSQPARLPQPPGVPATGLGERTSPPRLDPTTGMPVGRSDELNPEEAGNAGNQAAKEVHTLIFNFRYEDALQRCLAFHNKWQASASLVPLLGDWIELGRRYPKAKAALIEIRDGDVREFSEGRGYFDLFQEVTFINRYLHQEDVTCDLFKSFRDKDPKLAEQCYGFVEGLLVAKGEYQWCYDHMGDPQAKFDSIRQNFRTHLDWRERYKAIADAANNRPSAEMRQRHGSTNVPLFPRVDTTAMLKKSDEDGFVGQTRQLIEILVATGHRAEAERIRDQAVTVLDDARLKSAVSDAEGNIQKRSTPASRK